MYTKPPTMTELSPKGNFTAIQKLGEIAREIEMRKQVYPGQIARGNLTLKQAEKQMAIMREIAEDYREKATALEQKSRLL